jgi:hypothetical protein
MKKLIYLILIVILFSCSEKEVPTGNLSVTISYFHNNFIGNRADTGARIYLLEPVNGFYEFEGNLIEWRTGLLTHGPTGNDVRPFREAEADFNGVATIQNIPFGKYQLVAVSKNRMTYSRTNIEIKESETTMVKNFRGTNDYQDRGESW